MIHWSYNPVAMLTITPMTTLVQMATMVSMVKMIPLATLATLEPMDPVGSLNGDVSSKWRCAMCLPLHIEIDDITGVIGAINIIDTNGVNDAINCHLHHWIGNIASGAINTIGFNDTNGTNKSLFAPMDR